MKNVSKILKKKVNFFHFAQIYEAAKLFKTSEIRSKTEGGWDLLRYISFFVKKIDS